MLNEYVYNNKNQMFNPLAKVIGTLLIWVFTLMLLFILRQESGSFAKINITWYAWIIPGIVFCGGFYVIVRSFWRFRDTKHNIFINEKMIEFKQNENYKKIGFDEISEVIFTQFDETNETACNYLIKTKNNETFNIELKRIVHFANDYFTLTKAFLRQHFEKFEVRYKELIL